MLAATLVVGLVGCGDKVEGGKATQVAAKVNGDEITVHQINQEMGRLGNIPPEKAKDVANQVLKSIVDQQLLVQQAIDAKLDRDPRVVQILEANRRQVLAQAYLQRITENIAPPSEVEIRDYYVKHPELFSERRIYRLQELSVPVTPENAEMIKAKLAATGNLNDFARWLQEQKIQARAAQSVKAAEQLPMELLSRLHRLKDGQVLSLSTGDSLNIIAIAGSQAQPIDEAQAKPVIERFLMNSKKREVSATALKDLHAKAEVKYLGDYSAVQATEPEKPAKAPTYGQDSPVAAGGEGAPVTTSEQHAIDKGLRGLR